MAAAACFSLAAGIPNVTFASPLEAPDSTRPAPPPAPAPSAYVSVETRPSGLRVTIGTMEVGWSPLAATSVTAGRVTVRAYPGDARRFDAATDGVTLEAAPGETLRVSLDLRPHPLLRSSPAALVMLLGLREAESDLAVGETPLRLAPALLEERRFRFEAAGFADSVVAGSWLLETAEGGTGSVGVTLRSLHLPPPPPPAGPSLFGRRWFQWDWLASAPWSPVARRSCVVRETALTIATSKPATHE
ncbi:MAG: PEGA domain-containing protein [Candidatus Eisenbacteria bacterium]